MPRMTTQIPLVDYLVLEPQPHLASRECTSCGARFFDRRNACAGCFGTEFRPADVATDGVVKAFTIVTFADRDSHNAWRDHPLHRAAQQRGIDEFYETYGIQVADTTYEHTFTR